MTQNYFEFKKINTLPRLPFKGNIDLTYRCNNNCLHCWLKIPSSAKEKENELSFEEVKRIVEDAKKMGCQRWSISGGEPMLRFDFSEIFDYITGTSLSYSLNTNGTLIIPKIAKLMKRKGCKMISLYGSTAEIHDHITRNAGSFEATMRGLAYLKEAGASFVIQLIPMKDNYHQFKGMVSLAESLSKHYRIGAPWFHLSASGEKEINQRIMQQRLSPKEAVEFDKPDFSCEEWMNEKAGHCYDNPAKNDGLFASCIAARKEFHIEPYGLMTFCCFIKESTFRYDLRRGNFKECWDEFIPSLVDKVKPGKKYLDNCGSCELRRDCRWCPVYGYLEHRRFGVKIKYLCDLSRENRKLKDSWLQKHRRYYKIADITIRIDSDLPIKDDTFHSKFRNFETSESSENAVYITHHFSLPDLSDNDLGQEIYRKSPWAVYKKDGSWIYLGISSLQGDKRLHRVAVFNHNHTRARIYNDNEEAFLKGNLHSLTMFPTDQILLARILADREGCYLHSCGVNFNGRGLLFVGNSEAGKSTMATLLKSEGEILCDDRMIIRRRPSGFKIYGTWSHGDMPEVSCSSVPLRAILFLEKSKENRIIFVDDKKEVTKRLLSCLIKPFVTADWWEKTLSLIEKIIQEVPCYLLKFDKSRMAVRLLKKLK